MGKEFKHYHWIPFNKDHKFFDTIHVNRGKCIAMHPTSIHLIKHCTENTNQQVCTNSKAIHSTNLKCYRCEIYLRSAVDCFGVSRSGRRGASSRPGRAPRFWDGAGGSGRRCPVASSHRSNGSRDGRRRRSNWVGGGALVELWHAHATAAGSAAAGSEAGGWMLAAGMRQRSDKLCVSIKRYIQFCFKPRRKPKHGVVVEGRAAEG
jgi:hypothetical protein